MSFQDLHNRTVLESFSVTRTFVTLGQPNLLCRSYVFCDGLPDHNPTILTKAERVILKKGKNEARNNIQTEAFFIL